MTDSDEPKGKEKRQKGGLGKGFHAPLQLSDALAKFLGESATSDVIKRKWDYIKGNNLQVSHMLGLLESLFQS
ncbi:upstream activation factor subunit spp27-like protein [Trifolium pratense]|uniref:Upstream activation factor subunit spp27-like protein n=1 Tax=Trifolium pratense TaxID=57577 RepID=A0A2K3NCG5_TRIPR|nr:upstream activation factor subunit spp27-like protein [Trifolium pratense]